MAVGMLVLVVKEGMVVVMMMVDSRTTEVCLHDVGFDCVMMNDAIPMLNADNHEVKS